MRQRSVFRENWPNRLVGPRCLGLIVYQTVVLLLASGLVWAREDPKHAPDSAPMITQAATAPSAVGTDPLRVSSTASASKTFVSHHGWRFWAGVAVAASGIGVGVYALTAGGLHTAPNPHLGNKSVF